MSYLMPPMPDMTPLMRTQTIEKRLREPMRRIAHSLVLGETHHLSEEEQAVLATAPRILHHVTAFSDESETCAYPRYAKLNGVRYDVHAYTFGMTFEWFYEQKAHPLYVVGYIGTDDALHLLLPDNPFPQDADSLRPYDTHAREHGFEDFAALLADRRDPKNPYDAADSVRREIQRQLTGRTLTEKPSPLTLKGVTS